MSTMQRLTLMGLFNYDPTLFDNLELPEGYDRETFIDSLILEHGEKCVLYSDPRYVKSAIGAWGRKWALELTRIYGALTAEYDPIYNYDRHEEFTDSEGRKLTSTTNAGHKATDSPDFNVEQTTSGSVEHQVSADNSSDYQPESKDITNAGKTKTSGKTQDLAETSNSKTDDAETRNFTHKAHLYGNIGVTTNVDMWSQEVDARIKYNLYGAAARLFANELLIGIY